MPEIAFPSATDTPPRTDFGLIPWTDPVNGGSWFWKESTLTWSPAPAPVKLPDALFVGLTPNRLRVTGIVIPANNDPVDVQINSYSFDGEGNRLVTWGDPNSWFVRRNYGYWVVANDQISPTYRAVKLSDAVTPNGLTGWTVEVGTGQPDVECNDQLADYVGQLAAAAEAFVFGPNGPPWFRWDGQKWQEDAAVVDAITDGDMSAVTSNAVFDALALKAPSANPSFTGTATFASASSTGATTANSGGAKVYSGGLPGSEATYAGIWLAQAGANVNNYSFLASSSETFINAPTGGDLHFRVGNNNYAKVNAAAGFQIASAFGVTGNTTLAGITETPVAMGVVGATPALLINSGTMLTATLTASALSAFSMPTLAVGKSFTLYLKQAATTGMGTATFGATKWADGAAPTITPTAGRMDILTFSCPDGVNWYGSYTQNFTP